MIRPLGSTNQEVKSQAQKRKASSETPKTTPRWATWATIAKPKVQAFEVLFVHQGQKERTPIPRETFTKLYDKINAMVLQKVLDGESVPAEILWRSWKEGRDLIAVKDKETSEFLCQIIGKIIIQQNSFPAWNQGEIVTTHLEGNSFRFSPRTCWWMHCLSRTSYQVDILAQSSPRAATIRHLLLFELRWHRWLLHQPPTYGSTAKAAKPNLLLHHLVHSHLAEKF